MLEEVKAGLSLPQKEVPPTYFYDARGSQLFEEITQLPEYYLTRAEHALLERHAEEILDLARPVAIVELGAGTAAKSRTLLDVLRRREPRAVYAPVDVSAATLATTSEALGREYPGMPILPVAGDIRREFSLPPSIPRPLLCAFLGSTIGNFTRPESEELLRRIRSFLQPADHLLLGVDLVKDPAALEAAYNDKGGATAEFNLNVLHVLNRELGADFDIGAFRHQAFYNAQLRRVEMHLIASRPQAVRIPHAGEFTFAEGETLRTEISCKFRREDVEELYDASGFSLQRWMPEENQEFALALGVPRR